MYKTERDMQDIYIYEGPLTPTPIAYIHSRPVSKGSCIRYFQPADPSVVPWTSWSRIRRAIIDMCGEPGLVAVPGTAWRRRVKFPWSYPALHSYSRNTEQP